ncbi:MAG: glycosyltransferase, partial [bacterium]
CVTAGFAAKIAGVPILVTGRRSLGHYKDGHFFLRQRENLVCRWTDLAVANSEAVKTDALHRERISSEKMCVVYNGVRFPERSSSKGWDALLGRRIDGPVVCLVANFFRYKGHMDFLHAASMVLKRIPNATFLLVGDGRLRSEIEQTIACLGITERVVLTGSRIDADEIMGLSDLVALCSHEEGFPNVLLEAMAAGRPVVATRVGGVPEIVEEGVTGLLVPPRNPERLAEGIASILGDKREAKAMGRRGLDLVRKKFTIEKMVKSYEELYLGLLRENVGI